jgi:hypothetical protein
VTAPGCCEKKQVTATIVYSSPTGWRGLAQALTTAKAPWPAPPQSHESILKDVEAFYRDMAASLVAFIGGLAVWDELNETERDRFAEWLHARLPSVAAGRYEELFRRLAADCPEFGVWVNLSSHRATRLEFRTGLEDLEDLLTAMACGRLPDQRRAALARAYRAALEKPITPAGESTAQLQIVGAENLCHLGRCREQRRPVPSCPALGWKVMVGLR